MDVYIADSLLFSADGLDLLRAMLAEDPSERITAADALQHPYFTRAKGTAFLRT